MYLHRVYFRAVESYISFEADLADFLANIRANHDLWLHDGNSQKLATASADGTLLATIKEVCLMERERQRVGGREVYLSISVNWCMIIIGIWICGLYK